VVIPLARRGSGQAFVNQLKDKIEAGRFVPVVDRRYPLAAIADAYRYVQTGQKAGVVVIDVLTASEPE
jgi:NADPH:quinone reductase-like Zn-dependent oxidoreductase